MSISLVRGDLSMMVTTGMAPRRRMERSGFVSWIVVVWVRVPGGRVLGVEAVMVVQLAGAGEDVSITWWRVVTKSGGESVTGDGLELGKAGMVDPTKSSSMVSRG